MKDQSPSPVRAWAVKYDLLGKPQIEFRTEKELIERAFEGCELHEAYSNISDPIPLCELRELEELREAVKWIDEMMHLKTTFKLMVGNPVWLPEVQRHAQTILNVLEGK